jgi:hypothetical protein
LLELLFWLSQSLKLGSLSELAQPEMQNLSFIKPCADLLRNAFSDAR